MSLFVHRIAAMPAKLKNYNSLASYLSPYCIAK